MKVRFLRKHGHHRLNARVVLPDFQARQLVASGIAKEEPERNLYSELAEGFDALADQRTEADSSERPRKRRRYRRRDMAAE